MTMRIGPIELENPQIQIPSRQKVSDYFKPAVNKDNIVYTPVGQVPTSYSVKLAVPTYVYKQIEGISEWTAPYPIVLDELSQDMLGISGWGFIGNVKVEDNQNPETVIMSCDVAIIEPDENAFLKMDYTTGKESGTVIEKTYPDTVDESLFVDYFTSFDTTNYWETPITDTFSGTGISSVSNKLQLSGVTTSSGKRGTVFTVSQECYKAPFKMDFDMEWIRYATKNSYEMRIMLCSEKPVSIDDYLDNDHIAAYLYSKSTYCNLHFSKKIDGKTTELVTYDSLDNSSEKMPKIRFEVQSNGKLVIYKDTNGAKDSYGNDLYTKVWGASNPGWDFDDGLYVVIGFSNWNTTNETVNCADINLYTTVNTTPRNVVPYPLNCKIIDPSHVSTTRTLEDGVISLCTNPSDYMVLQTSFDNWDDGSVKVFNNNNESSTYRRVFNDENVFTSTSWYASNGLIKLSCDTNNNINFYNWDVDCYKNLVGVNVATGTDYYGNTSFFGAVNSAALTSSTDWCKNGTSSLKIVAPGNVINEGIQLTQSGLIPNMTYAVRRTIYTPTGGSLTMAAASSSSQVTLAPGEVRTVTTTFTATGTTHFPSIYTTNKQAMTFYVDEYIIMLGTTIPTATMNMSTGNLMGWTNVNNFQLSKNVTVNGISTPTIQPITYVKPFFISPDRCIIQINDTYWWLLRGKQHFIVNHSDTDISYIRRGFYNVGKALTYGPAPNADIDMTSAFYCNVYDTYNLLKGNQSNVDVNVIGLYGYGSLGSTTLTRDATTFKDGTGSAKLTSTYSGTQTLNLGLDQGTNNVYYVPIFPGRTYTVSAWGKRDVTGTANISLYWYDIDGNQIGNIISGASGTADTTWRQFLCTATAPNNAYFARFYLSAPNVANGGSLWYDSAMFTEGINSNSIFITGQTDDDTIGINRLQIVQAVPTKIKSDLIPATDYSGIGWFNNSKDPDADENGYVKLAREFFNVVDTKITK